MSGSYKCGEEGFSLVELTVVLVIIIAGLAIVGPNISSGRDTALTKGVARDLASALRYARGQALISDEEMLVTINLEDKNYKVSNREQLFSIPKSISVTLVTAESELNGEGEGSIRFYTDGSSTGGRITLESGEIKWLVDINWLTGHVELINE